MPNGVVANQHPSLSDEVLPKECLWQKDEDGNNNANYIKLFYIYKNSYVLNNYIYLPACQKCTTSIIR
jgi:hypothetical protein